MRRVGGTVGARDGAVEPTWTYSWRVPTARTRTLARQLSYRIVLFGL